MKRIMESIRAANSFESIHDAAAQISDLHGFDYFCIGTQIATSMARPLLLLVDAYPRAWREQYMANKYFHADPVIRHARSAVTPALWEDIARRSFDNDDGGRVMSEAADAGLRSGVVLPCHGVGGTLSVFSLVRASATRADRDDYEAAMAQLALSAQFMHEAMLRAARSDCDVDFQSVDLTDLEQECLLWAADGKTSWEIASILGVGERNVVYTLAKAGHKLDAPTRQQAVAKAVSQGLIKPQAFRIFGRDQKIAEKIRLVA